MIISEVLCDPPQTLDNAADSWSSLSINSTTNYTCLTGYYVPELETLYQNSTCNLNVDGVGANWTDVYNCSGGYISVNSIVSY